MDGYNFTLSKRIIEDQVYFVFVLSKGDVILEEVIIIIANFSLFLKKNALTQTFWWVVSFSPAFTMVIPTRLSR